MALLKFGIDASYLFARIDAHFRNSAWEKSCFISLFPLSSSLYLYKSDFKKLTQKLSNGSNVKKNNNNTGNT